MAKKKKSAVLDRAEERSTWSVSDPALAEWMGLGGRTYAGVNVNELSALGSTAVYRAVCLISGTIAGLPLKSYRTLPDGTRERVSSFLDDPAGPNGGYTPFEWVELVMVHLLLHGNAFLRHVYNGAGGLVGLEPLHPSLVTVKRVDEVWRKEFTVHLCDGTQVVYTPIDLTHLTALGTDGVMGLSPIQVCRQAIGAGLAGDEAAARMFGSGMLLGGLVSYDDSQLSEEQAERIKAGLKAKLAGPSKAGDVAFVNAMLKFSPWTMSSEDAQFIESRVHQVEEVARIFGVPPHLLGQTEKQTSWGTGVSEQNRGLARYTLAPWTTRLEQRLSDLLPQPRVVEFDYAGLLQPSPEEEIRLLLEQVAGGLLTVDEARRIRNLGPAPAAPATPDPEEG